MQAIRFIASVNPNTANQLFAMIDELRSQKCDSVHLLLATGGGATESGIAIYNYLKACEMKITAINMGHVASIGTVIFCGAYRRLSMPNARFSFHPNTFNVRGEILGIMQLQEKVSHLEIEHNAIAQIVADASGQSVEKAKALILEHRSLSALEGKDFGFVHEVTEFKIPNTANMRHITE